MVYGEKGKVFRGKFPTSAEKLKEFDLLIFLDTPGFLFNLHKEMLADFLKDKSGLFLFGEQMIQRRNLTPFADFLPFDLKTTSISHKDFNLSLTETGRFHPITRLSQDPFENVSLWSNLPPFLGIIGLGDLKPEAKVLAEYVRNEESHLPGIVVRTQAKSKIMAVLVYPFWRWDFWLWGVGKDNQAFQNLWENSIRWLTTPEDLERFDIKTDKLVYKSGEPIEFQAKLYDESYQKVEDAFVQVRSEDQGAYKRDDSDGAVIPLCLPGVYETGDIQESEDRHHDDCG